jgi:hypothetical protein
MLSGTWPRATLETRLQATKVTKASNSVIQKKISEGLDGHDKKAQMRWDGRGKKDG